MTEHLNRSFESGLKSIDKHPFATRHAPTTQRTASDNKPAVKSTSKKVIITVAKTSKSGIDSTKEEKNAAEAAAMAAAAEQQQKQQLNDENLEKMRKKRKSRRNKRLQFDNSNVPVIEENAEEEEEQNEFAGHESTMLDLAKKNSIGLVADSSLPGKVVKKSKKTSNLASSSTSSIKSVFKQNGIKTQEDGGAGGDSSLNSSTSTTSTDVSEQQQQHQKKTSKAKSLKNKKNGSVKTGNGKTSKKRGKYDDEEDDQDNYYEVYTVDSSPDLLHLKQKYKLYLDWLSSNHAAGSSGMHNSSTSSNNNHQLNWYQYEISLNSRDKDYLKKCLENLNLSNHAQQAAQPVKITTTVIKEHAKATAASSSLSQYSSLGYQNLRMLNSKSFNVPQPSSHLPSSRGNLNSTVTSLPKISSSMKSTGSLVSTSKPEKIFNSSPNFAYSANINSSSNGAGGSSKLPPLSQPSQPHAHVPIESSELPQMSKHKQPFIGGNSTVSTSKSTSVNPSASGGGVTASVPKGVKFSSSSAYMFNSASYNEQNHHDGNSSPTPYNNSANYYAMGGGGSSSGGSVIAAVTNITLPSTMNKKPILKQQTSSNSSDKSSSNNDNARRSSINSTSSSDKTAVSSYATRTAMAASLLQQQQMLASKLPPIVRCSDDFYAVLNDLEKEKFVKT
jgi:hypothetical protein